VLQGGEVKMGSRKSLDRANMSNHWKEELYGNTGLGRGNSRSEGRGNNTDSVMATLFSDERTD